MAGHGTRYAAYGCSGHGERSGWLEKVAKEVALVSISVIDFIFQERIYVRIRRLKIVIQQSLRLHLMKVRSIDVYIQYVTARWLVSGEFFGASFAKVRVQHVLGGLLMRRLETKTCMVSAAWPRVIGRACILPACLSPPRLSRSWVRHAVRPSRAAMLVGHCLEAK
jgi:hypothetical protein